MRDIVIFCAEAFSSGWGGATQRFIQIATGLARYNWRTTIVRSRNASLNDESAKTFLGKVVTTPFPTDPYPPFLDWYGMRLLYRKGCAFIGKQDIFDPRKGWPEHVTDPRYSGLLDLPVDVVLGVSFGHVRSLYAAKSFAQKRNRPFLLEFQDTCPEPHKTLYDIQQVRLEECMHDCHGVITTSASYADLLKKKYPAYAGKVFPLYLSYEESSETNTRNENANHRVTLLHAGTLYGKGQRNADAFLYALKRAADIDLSIREKCCFQIIGGGQGAKRAGKLAQKLGIGTLVDIRDSVSYSHSIVAMDRADVLIVIKYPDPAYSFQIPGKTFQYFGRKKPILGIMGACEAADLIKKSGLGTIIPHDRIDEITSYIVRYVNNRRLLKDDFRPNQRYIEQFSVSSMACNLHNYLDEIVSTFTSS